MPSVRVLTLNLWNREGPWEQRRELLRAWFERLEPDLVGLQEVSREQSGTPAWWSASRLVLVLLVTDDADHDQRDHDPAAGPVDPVRDAVVAGSGDAAARGDLEVAGVDDRIVACQRPGAGVLRADAAGGEPNGQRALLTGGEHEIGRHRWCERERRRRCTDRGHRGDPQLALPEVLEVDGLLDGGAVGDIAEVDPARE